MSEPAPQSKRSGWRIALFASWLILSAWFLVRTGQQHWIDFKNIEVTVNWWMILGALFFSMSSVIILGACWVFILRRLAPAASIPMCEGLSVQAISQAGKYIPGGMAPIVAKYTLARRWQVSAEAVGASMVLEVLYGISALALLTIGVGQKTTFAHLLTLLALIIVVMAGLLLRPGPWRIIGRLASRFHHRLNIFIPPPLPFTTHLLFIFWYLASIILMGVGFILLIEALFPGLAVSVWAVIQIFAAGLLIGFVAVTAPAGLGVREVVLVALLQNVLPIPTALTIAITARIWTMASDALFFLVGLVVRVRRHLTISST